MTQAETLVVKSFEKGFFVFPFTTQECWQWTASQRPRGNIIYGSLWDNLKKKMVPAHRVFYQAFVGNIPSDMVCDHLCRNPKCVNPWHLQVVSLRENILRGIGPTAKNAKKTMCPQGHPYSGNNLMIRKQGWRACRTCYIEHQQRHKLNRRKKSK